MDIAALIYLALFICVLFISSMQLVNGAQFLNTTSTLLFPSAAATSATVIFPLANIYASLKSHQIDLNIEIF